MNEGDRSPPSLSSWPGGTLTPAIMKKEAEMRAGLQQLETKWLLG